MREEGPFRLHLRELSISAPAGRHPAHRHPRRRSGRRVLAFQHRRAGGHQRFRLGSHRGLGSHAELRVLHLLFRERLRPDRRHVHGPELRREKCRSLPGIFRWCMLFGFASSLILGVAFTALGTRALGLFTTDAAALSFGLVRLWFVELPDCLTTFYEVPAGAMRGMGWSTLTGHHHHPRLLRAARGARDLGVPAVWHLGRPHGDLPRHLVVHDRGHARLLRHRAPPLLRSIEPAAA